MIVSVNTTWFARVAPTAKSLGVYGSGAETVSATPSSQVIGTKTIWGFNARRAAAAQRNCSRHCWLLSPRIYLPLPEAARLRRLVGSAAR